MAFGRINSLQSFMLLNKDLTNQTEIGKPGNITEDTLQLKRPINGKTCRIFEGYEFKFSFFYEGLKVNDVHKPF